jgi:hypothetical protein
MIQFVMTQRFLEGVTANYDGLVTPGVGGCLEVIVSAEYRDVVTSLITARVQVTTSDKM